MAPTAKLTTGPGVPRAETIREQFCEPSPRRMGYLAARRAEEGGCVALEKDRYGSLPSKWLRRGFTERERNTERNREGRG